MSSQRFDSDQLFEDPSEFQSLVLHSPLSSERVLGYVLWAALGIVIFGVGTI